MKETIGELNSLLVMGDQCIGFSWGSIYVEVAMRSGKKNQASVYWIYIKASCKCNIGNSFNSEAQ